MNNFENDKECMERFKVEGKLQMPFEVPDNQIYMYFGHGGDLCDKKGNLIKKIVPPNCIYISQTVCGVINRQTLNWGRLFASQAYAHIWRDPLQHIDKIKKLFGPYPSIHVHLPGCTYIDNYFYPVDDVNVSDRPIKDSVVINYSGLMSLESALNTTIEEKKLFNDKTYKASSGNSLNNLIADELPTDEIRKYFEKSVFPKFPDVKHSYISGFYLSIIRRNLRKPVSELMKMFPGIHYNFTCRSIADESCKPAILLRRTESALAQNTQYNTLYKMVNYDVDNNEIENFVNSMHNFYLSDRNITKIKGILDHAKKIRSPRKIKILESLYKELLKEEINNLMSENKLNVLTKELLPSIPDEYSAFVLEHMNTKRNEFKEMAESFEESYKEQLKKKIDSFMSTQNLNTFEEEFLPTIPNKYLDFVMEYISSKENKQSQGGRRKRKTFRRKTLKKKRT